MFCCHGLRAVWIEIAKVDVTTPRSSSHGLRAVWIEIPDALKIALDSRVTACGPCGLKS